MTLPCRRRALWEPEAALERLLPELFSPNQSEVLDAARVCGRRTRVARSSRARLRRLGPVLWWADDALRRFG